MGSIINARNAAILLIIGLGGWMLKTFPEETLLIGGISAILLIGVWLRQAYSSE